MQIKLSGIISRINKIANIILRYLGIATKQMNL